jgi:multimeric flavodoxin WrbA
MDVANPRYSTSDALLDISMAQAAELGAETRLIRLAELKFRPCEGYYSKSAHACTWPCSITQMDPDDQMERVYEAVVHWGDVLLVATPIRWGNASSLYYKMAERLNCVQNQVTIHNRLLIERKTAAFIITGGQDNIQGVAGQLLTFWSELGFVFPPFPFIAHSRGWDAEDMQNNVRLVRASESLKAAAEQLAERALENFHVIDGQPAHAKPMERAGRKAQPLTSR